MTRKTTTLPAIAQPVTSIATLTPRAREFAGKSRAARTVQGYASDWRRFQGWCRARNVQSLPAAPATVADYIAQHATGDDARKAGTLARWLAAISSAHRTRGVVDPTKDQAVELVWHGIRRTIGTAQQGKAPVLTADLRRMLAPLTDSMRDTRDRALLLLGFAGALRRSELVGLNAEDLEQTPEGIKVLIRRSKTDQEGKGQAVGVPYGANADTCPVLALRRWLEVSGIASGPVFRAVNKGGRVVDARLTAQVVALVVKDRATAAGIDAARLAGHSLRRGLATSAALAGVPDRVIQKQGRWTGQEMVGRYTADANLFRENAAGRVGL